LTTAPLDTDALRRISESLGDDREFVVDLVEQFIADTPGLIAAARTGLAAGDLDEVRRAAHTLKSNAATFGARELADRSRRLEEAARSGTVEDGVGQIDAIANELERVCRTLPDAAADL